MNKFKLQREACFYDPHELSENYTEAVGQLKRGCNSYIELRDLAQRGDIKPNALIAWEAAKNWKRAWSGRCGQYWLEWRMFESRLAGNIPRANQLYSLARWFIGDHYSCLSRICASKVLGVPYTNEKDELGLQIANHQAILEALKTPQGCQLAMQACRASYEEEKRLDIEAYRKASTSCFDGGEPEELSALDRAAIARESRECER
jgi:hypothetical protein